jgi:MarR family transcriptional regulator, lower aerobic nicotinate degradation pathway regulator
MGSQALGEDVRTIMDDLRHIVRSLRVSARAAEKVTTLSGAQVFVLQCLTEAKATSLAELASRTATDQSSVSVVVSRLVERALVRRVPSTEDARRVEIRVTAAGRALLRRSPEMSQTHLIEAIRRLPRASQRSFARTLHELVSAMELDGQPEMFFENERHGRPNQALHGRP